MLHHLLIIRIVALSIFATLLKITMKALMMVLILLRAGWTALIHHLIGRWGRRTVWTPFHKFDRFEEFFGVCAVNFLLSGGGVRRAGLLEGVDADFAGLDALLADLGVGADARRRLHKDARWWRLKVDHFGSLYLQQSLLCHWADCATLRILHNLALQARVGSWIGGLHLVDKLLLVWWRIITASDTACQFCLGHVVWVVCRAAVSH